MPVVVSGVPELRRALKKYAPDLRKEMDSEIRSALAEVRDKARAKVPGSAPGGLYNWNDTGKEVRAASSKYRPFPAYNAAIIKKELTYKLGSTRFNKYGFSGLYSLLNKSAAGAIIEKAGTVNPAGRPQAGFHHSKSTKLYGNSNNPNAGKMFIGAMNGVGPLKKYDKFDRNRGRLLYAAYAENQGKALDATMRAIDKASKALQARSQARKAA